MTAVIIGILFIFIGGFGIFYWSSDLIHMLRGLGPISIFVGGCVALIAGLASFRPPRSNDKKKE